MVWAALSCFCLVAWVWVWRVNVGVAWHAGHGLHTRAALQNDVEHQVGAAYGGGTESCVLSLSRMYFSISQ